MAFFVLSLIYRNLGLGLAWSLYVWSLPWCGLHNLEKISDQINNGASLNDDKNESLGLQYVVNWDV